MEGVSFPLIAYHQYAPASVASYPGTADLSDVDSTNLAVTFTVPASGKTLLIRFDRYVQAQRGRRRDLVGASQHHRHREDGADRRSDGWNHQRVDFSVTTTHLLTGLTAGTSVTALWAAAATSTSDNVVRALDNGGSTSAAPTGQGAPATMEVYAA